MLLVSWLTLLAACSKDESASDKAIVAKHSASSASSVVSAYVHAVQVTVGETPIDLTFELQSKPMINQPVAMNVRMTAMFNVTGVTARFGAHEPLKINEAPDWTIDALQAGQAQDHSISFVASTLGVYAVDVAVETTRDGFAKTFTYSIPVAITDAAAASSASVAAAK